MSSNYYCFDKYCFVIWQIALVGLSIPFQLIGTCIVCGMRTDGPEPPCWAKCCFPLCTVIRFDPNNCGACCGAWCFGWCFTMMCWVPPQRNAQRQKGFGGAPVVQVMMVPNANASTSSGYPQQMQQMQQQQWQQPQHVQQMSGGGNQV